MERLHGRAAVVIPAQPTTSSHLRLIACYAWCSPAPPGPLSPYPQLQFMCWACPVRYDTVSCILCRPAAACRRAAATAAATRGPAPRAPRRRGPCSALRRLTSPSSAPRQTARGSAPSTPAVRLQILPIQPFAAASLGCAVADFLLKQHVCVRPLTMAESNVNQMCQDTDVKYHPVVFWPLRALTLFESRCMAQLSAQSVGTPGSVMAT